MNYKLDKLICSVAIVSTIMPLTACQQKKEDITLSRKNEISHLINPMDWSNTPDYVNIIAEDNYISMDIETFFRLLNKSGKDLIIQIEDNQIVLDKQIIKDKIEQEFYDYNTPSLDDYLKITITLIEGTILLIIGNKVVTILEKPKEKIKKKS